MGSRAVDRGTGRRHLETVLAPPHPQPEVYQVKSAGDAQDVISGAGNGDQGGESERGCRAPKEKAGANSGQGETRLGSALDGRRSRNERGIQSGREGQQAGGDGEGQCGAEIEHFLRLAGLVNTSFRGSVYSSAECTQ